MVTKVPAFEVSERLRSRLRGSETRSTMVTQLNANPDHLNTVLVPDGTLEYRRYGDTILLSSPGSYFTFDTSISDKYPDSMRSNPTDVLGDVFVDQEPLILAPNGGDAGFSVQVNDANGIVGRLLYDPWPGTHEFWLSTEDIGSVEFFTIESTATSVQEGFVVFTLNVDGKLTADTRNVGGTVLRSQISDAAVNDGVSRHIVYRDNGTTCTLVINGVEQ